MSAADLRHLTRLHADVSLQRIAVEPAMEFSSWQLVPKMPSERTSLQDRLCGLAPLRPKSGLQLQQLIARPTATASHLSYDLPMPEHPIGLRDAVIVANIHHLTSVGVLKLLYETVAVLRSVRTAEIHRFASWILRQPLHSSHPIS